MREKHGVDMTAHRSAMLSHADVLEATHIYCMAQRHHDAVLSLERQVMAYGEPSPLASTASSHSAAEDWKNPSSSPRDLVVPSVFNPEIPDPWRGTIERYQECTERISEVVKKALEEDISVQDPRKQQQAGSSAKTRDQQKDSRSLSS